MATVHHGVLCGESGFSRTVAIKRLHAHYAEDAEFSAMLRDEARVTARIRHPHVVPTLDVVASDDELFLVMEYVHGESLASLVRAAQRGEGGIPRDVVSAIVCGALHGLHAAHEATDEAGAPLQIVHRDVSPQNIMVGADGVTRVLDFGIAKAVGRASQTTRSGELKGKVSYMAPEQLTREPLDRRVDVYAMGVVTWELLTLQRLFPGGSEAAILQLVLSNQIDRPSLLTGDVSAALDEVVARAVSGDREKRFATAREMALALEAAVPIASATRLAAWVEELAGEALARRAQGLADAESSARSAESTAVANDGGREEGAPASESDVPTVTNAVIEEPRHDAREPRIGTPPSARASRKGWWIGSAAVLATGALVAFAATRPPRPAVVAPSPAPSMADLGSTLPADVPDPSAPKPLNPAPLAPLVPPSPISPASAASPSESARTAASSRPASRATGRAPGKPPVSAGAGAAPSSRQRCDWHNEDGIWVPTNCR